MTTGNPERGAARQMAVDTAVADVRGIVAKGGVTRSSLSQVKARLMTLATQSDLFSKADFPPPSSDAENTSNIYRVSEDTDHQFALYVQSAKGRLDTPAHNHATWAVIAGIQGEELNRLYNRTPENRASQVGELIVKKGSAIAFMPDDLHSIHVDGSETVINFHMYGLALDHLHERECFHEESGDWRNFPAQQGIIDARNSRTA